MPSINSYKRIEDLSFAPSNVTWGGDNRTTSFRVAGHGKSMRLENRIPGADANAHLIYAAMIASGLYGVENEIEPIGPFVEANAYELENPPSLHRNLTQATDALERSETVRALLGDNVVDHYVGVARWEIAEFEKYVTDWERRRYFELI
jgi:glutamine synthetase